MWEAIGLSSLEERLYRLLLRDPKITPDEAARRLESSAETVGAALARLQETGLMESDPLSGFRPADPRMAIGSAIRRRRAELDRLAVEAEELATDFQEGLLRADPGRVIEVVEGAAAAGRKVAELLAQAQEEILAIDTPPYATSGTSIAAESAALARGVRVRALYSSLVLDIPKKLDEIRQVTAVGEQARILAEVPIKLILVDRSTALLPLTDREEGVRFTSVVVGRSALTNALVALFETLWREASPVWGNGTGAIDGVDQQILELLAVGMKDEAILRQLGMSERTLRRRIATLLSRLGATGRFQAGVQAARKGWI